MAASPLYKWVGTRFSRTGRVMQAFTAFLVAIVGLQSSSSVHAQVGGRGQDPIPAFRQDVGGGGGSVAVVAPATPIGVGPTVNFDPAASYLPSPPTGQTYQYTLIWDFGDGSPVLTVGPGNSGAALAPVQHIFPIPPVFPTSAFIDPNTPAGGLYTVTLRIDVTVGNLSGVSSPGPSASTNGLVRSAATNYAPVWSLTNNSSPATGALPYQVNVNSAASYDPDGYIIWAAISWGDGSSDLLANLPPSNVAISSLHNYTAPGTYAITLSLIDNGRMAIGTALDPTPSANDPVAALNFIKNLQHSQIDTGVLAGPVDPATGRSIYTADKYLPILRQEFLQVQVPGNLTVVKGTFTLNFAKQGNDAFDCTFLLNEPVTAVAAAHVKIFFGDPSLPASLVLQEFTTDLKGNYFNQAQGLKFTLTPKKHFMRFQIKSAALQNAFKIGSSTVVNGFVDIPITVQITGPTAMTVLSSKIRFVYNARAGAIGKGKNPRSTLVGN